MIYWLEVDLLDSRREADLFLFSSLASLASFCLWAKILAYSAAASLFFSPLLLFSSLASLASFCLWAKILAQRQKEAKEARELKRKRSASLRESKRSTSSQEIMGVKQATSSIFNYTTSYIS